MVENTKIEWADHTFNPWIGCTKVGPGCDNCYAEELMDTRYGRVEWGPGNARSLTSDEYWVKPVLWNAKARKLKIRYRVFCASLADVFDNEVPQEWRDRLFGLIASTPHLDWLLLTKRIGNVTKMLPSSMIGLPLSNVWIGATIVNQQEADRDIPKLLATPAAKRFLSMEPLLGPVGLRKKIESNGEIFTENWLTGSWQSIDGDKMHCGDGQPKIDWVIVGGESGKKARPMEAAWAISLRDQCAAAGVAFLFKQWGEWVPSGHTSCPLILLPKHAYYSNLKMWRAGKKLAGRLLDGNIHDGVPA